MRTAGIAHVGEAGEFAYQGAVEPESGLGVRVQVHEYLLGIEGQRQAPVVHRELLAVQCCRVQPLRLDSAGCGAGTTLYNSGRAGWANLVGTAPPRRILPAVLARERLEVVQQAMSELGADRFRVELHTPDRPALVPHAHQDPVFGPRQRLELVGQFRNVERVIANGGEGRRNSGEDLGAGVVDAAGPAVHHRRNVVHLAAEQVAEALVTEAHAQHGYRCLQNRLSANPEITLDFRAPGPRRDHDVVEIEVTNLLPGRGIVAHDQGRGAVHLGQVLVEVERERVVVIDQQRLHSQPSEESLPMAGLSGVTVPVARELVRTFVTHLASCR